LHRCRVRLVWRTHEEKDPTRSATTRIIVEGRAVDQWHCRRLGVIARMDLICELENLAVLDETIVLQSFAERFNGLILMSAEDRLDTEPHRKS
jgi:hypothetical protein